MIFPQLVWWGLGNWSFGRGHWRKGLPLSFRWVRIGPVELRWYAKVYPPPP